MNGVKGSHDGNFIGFKVRHKKLGACVVVKAMTDEEYKASGFDYSKFYTIKDAAGNLTQCGRSDYTILKNQA